MDTGGCRGFDHAGVKDSAADTQRVTFRETSGYGYVAIHETNAVKRAGVVVIKSNAEGSQSR